MPRSRVPRFPRAVAPLLAAALALALGGCGGAPTASTRAGGAPEPAGAAYGAPLDAETVSFAALFQDTKKYEGKKVRVEGTVTDVCPKRGCWMKVGDPAGFEEVTFKVTDGVIVIPMNAKGKPAQAEGVVREIELSLERSKEYLAHLAEEKGETFDPATVTEPVRLVKLEGTGAVIRDGT